MQIQSPRLIDSACEFCCNSEAFSWQQGRLQAAGGIPRHLHIHRKKRWQSCLHAVFPMSPYV
ncbi:hypothetical protein BIFPSEUDO_02782 [Bifidobacterium pseudocatenulatum DSM 20438 = JCM 1200 = LMG 10505]|uniref:Uncharacterized protein n=1 Tax=Bifidobacterium pseudocatenulatum DSM 20438 = JCM 1200 = LMG 10505 TaxID=547043 RepID=C0BQX7_BIFPS|nr:hypothetical protein BIFPSEUDO_02782 [Bifidobacterium pseudocatenulatum DSM 20438 = JCM 1200 = LMG 10505]